MKRMTGRGALGFAIRRGGWTSAKAARQRAARCVAVALLAGLAVAAGGRVQAGPSLATPAAVAQGLLMQATLAPLPAEPGFVFLERWTYMGHAGPVAESGLVGPMLIFVVEGRLTVAANAPAQALRGLGVSRPEPVDAGAAMLLNAGDGAVIPSDAASTSSNPDAAPAVAIVVWMTPLFADASPHYPPAALVKREHLQDADSLISPNPVRIELRRATLAPGETLPPPATPFELVGAESKYLGWLIPHLDQSLTNGEKQPLGVLILTRP